MTVAVVPEPKRREPPSLELASYGDLLFRGLLTLAAVPFILIMLACLALVIWQPWVAMYVPTGKW